jgi:uncharacterized protein
MSGSRYVLFQRLRKALEGDIAEVTAAARRLAEAEPDALPLAFDVETGRLAELNLRPGTPLPHPPAPPPAARGRPKLGVTPREVTLLPSHWDWLSAQPGGASVTLRRLVEAARRSPAEQARARREAAYRFMSVMAGDLPGFEEAARALFAGNRWKLMAETKDWPKDVADQVMALLGEP